MSAFDHVAGLYDNTFTDTSIGQAQRKQVWAYLDGLLKKENIQSVLELNCGTGADALRFAEAGCTVLATDVSAEMVRQVSTKAQKAGLQHKLQTAVLGFEELSQNPQEGPYDLIFSNFGGLNCIDAPALRRLSTALSKSLRPGGHFVAVIMPKSCLWEQFYFLAKGKPFKAFRRSKGYCEVHVEGSHVPTWYFSPKEFRACFEAEFNLVEQKPIGFCIPPSYMQPFFNKHPNWLKTLEAREASFAQIKAAAAFSDHALFGFRKLEMMPQKYVPMINHGSNFGVKMMNDEFGRRRN